ncbi:MAG: YdcF family protein [Bacteroidetes bacterium]|nr:YdcF family protein [Bacteroidota bacterium]
MILRILKYTFVSLGCLFIILILLSLTSAPFWTWYNMSTKHAGIHRPPDAIILLGGGGMPSESGLIRCWYAAKAANHFTRAKVIIALPGDIKDSLSSINGMKKELILRGIAGDRILLEDSGTNTRAQAINVKKLIADFYSTTHSHTSSIQHPASSILIVTSPEHLYRAVLTFKKAGFRRVDGLPAFESAIESDITFNDRMLGGRRWMPPIGKNITIRYQFWTQLHYEQLVIREWLAVVYYKLKGWI